MSIPGPITLRIMLEPDIDAALDQILTKSFDNAWSLLLFCFSVSGTTIFIVFSANMCLFKPAPQNVATLFVSTTENIFWGVLCIFGFGGFAMSVLLTCFLLGKNKASKNTEKKLTRRNQTGRFKQAKLSSLVFWKQKENAHMKHSNFIKKGWTATRKKTFEPTLELQGNQCFVHKLKAKQKTQPKE